MAMILDIVETLGPDRSEAGGLRVVASNYTCARRMTKGECFTWNNGAELTL
jgi:hypothetical protein